MRRLSKSKLIAFRQCKRRLWLEVNRPELREDSDATKTKFNTGNMVGEIAQRLYDPDGRGETINAQVEGYESAYERTQALLEGNAPIFEAGFQIGGALAFADVMLPMGSADEISWRMIEVKSSTSVKEYHHDDIAIQAHIARKSGVNLKAIALAHIDNTWIYSGNGRYVGLLREMDFTEAAFARDAEVESWIDEAQEIIAKSEKPFCKTGNHCYEPFECGFLKHCSSFEDQAEYPVSLLPNISTKALKSYLVESEARDLRDVPDSLLNEVQLRVKKCTLENRVFFDSAATKAVLSQYALPAAFMDFETVSLPIPILPGTRPYERVPFQFSVHVIDNSGAITHREFLDLSGSDPRRQFAETIIDSCKWAKTVYVYSAGFENSMLKELALQFPDLKDGLYGIVERVVDLLPITRSHYYHPDQQGNWSIKKVLPTIVPDLDYANLDGVADGSLAMEAYKEAVSPETASERKAQIEMQLKKYCGLDTHAMVKLWQKFCGE